METRKDPKTWCDGGEFDSKRVANYRLTIEYINIHSDFFIVIVESTEVVHIVTIDIASSMPLH